MSSTIRDEDASFELMSVQRLFVPGALAGLIAYQSLTVSPLIVGALIDHRGFSTSLAGFVSRLEVFSMALMAFILAPFINRLPRHYWAIGATLTLALMQFSSAFNLMPALFYVERVFAGLSAGVLVAILAATIPLARNPERLTALIILFDSSVAVGLYLALPYFIADYGPVGAYAFLGGLTLLSAPVFLFLPRRGPKPTKLSATMRGDTKRLAAYAVLVSTASMALWSFTERMGVAIGLGLETIGTIFAGGIFVGLAGATLAALVGQKWGSFWPVVVATTCLLFTVFFLPQVSAPLVFIILFGVSRFVYNFNDPFLVGIVSRLDTQGRLMAVNAGAGLLGASFGQLIAGLLVEGGAYYRIGYLSTALMIIGYGIFARYLWADQAR